MSVAQQTPVASPLSHSPLRWTAAPAPSSPAVAPPEFKAHMVQVLPYVSFCARRLTRHAADAEDLVQETYRRALEAHAQFSPGSNIRAWLQCILRNHHRDRLRRATREIAVGDGIEDLPAALCEETEPAASSFVSDEDTALALASLPPVFRVTYALYAVSGLSYSEIAARLGIPCATVGTRVRRARLRLRQFLLQRTRAAIQSDGERSYDGLPDTSQV